LVSNAFIFEIDFNYEGGTLLRRIGVHRFLSMTLTLGLVLSPLAGLFPRHVSAADEAVNVYMTTWDKSKLLSKESDMSFSQNSVLSDQTIQVDETRTYQTMDGFGASLTDSSAYVIYKYLNEDDRKSLMETLFSPEKGAGFSYLRLPMGASDFAVSSYTYDDMPQGQTDPGLKKFSINHDKEYIIPVLKQALKINPELRIMATPWSAPGWMKTTGKLEQGKLLPQYYATYAQYFVKFIQEYSKKGIPIHAVTVQNEPQFEPADYPGMRMDAGEQAEFIKNYLGPAFKKAGITTQIIGYDHNWDNPGYPLEVLSDPEANAYIAGSAFHSYAGSVDNQAQVHDQYPDKGIYFTESSGVFSYPVFGDNVNWDLSNLIIGSTRYWAKTVLKWNLALDENSGPTIGGCQDCRGVVTVNSQDGSVTLNEEYYAFGQVSKFVRPGAVRIYSSAFASGGIENVAFKNTDGSKVLIALNSASIEQEFQVKWGGKSFRYTLPAKAVATFKWSGNQSGEAGVNPYSRVEAEDYTVMSGIRQEVANDTGGGQLAGSTANGGYIAYANTEFVKGTASVKVRYSAVKDAVLEFRLNSPDGPYIGGGDLASTGGAQSWITKSIAISVPEGKYDLYVIYKGQLNLNWLQFSYDSVKSSLNYMTRNGDFEEGNLNSWTSWSPEGQNSAQSIDTDGPRSGNYKLTHWYWQGYEQRTYRTVEVPNGTYKASVWVRKGDHIDTWLEVSNYGGNDLSAASGSSYIGDWKQLVIPEIRVTDGKVDIGVRSASSASEWAVFDDFALTPVVSKAPVVAVGKDAPDTPQGVTADVYGDGFDIGLSWLPVAGAEGYAIYRSSVNDNQISVTEQVYSDYSEIGLSRQDQPYYEDKGLRGGVTYYYRVTAFNGSGQSLVTQAVYAKTAEGTDSEAPFTPAGLTAEAGVEKVVLRWDHNLESDFEKYNVYVNGTKVASVDPVTESRYTVQNLSPGKLYEFTISSVDQSGNESPQSEAAKASPKAAGILVPFNNLDFETGDFTGWSEWHPGGQSLANFVDADSPIGKFKLTHWGPSDYEQSTYRTLEVPNGDYKVQVMVRTGGGQDTFRLEVKNYGGESLYKDLKSASGSTWTPFYIDNIHVTNGKLEIGVYSDAKAGNWAAIDNFEIYSYPPAAQ
jgi:O-glycosyl hydrolase